MKYYSYLDNFDISLEDLTNYSSYLIKEVNEALDGFEEKEKISILNGLNDATQRSYHITIEEHDWLKRFLLKDFENLKASEIALDLKRISYVYGFQLFLELYLRVLLPEFLDFCFNNQELKLLYNVLDKVDLFSQQCENIIVNFLNRKVNNACAVLSQDSDYSDYDQITYIKNYHFYQSLNIYSPKLEKVSIQLYDEILEKATLYDNSLEDNPRLYFLQHAQIAFKKKEVEDVATKLLIDDNAEIAIENTIKDSTEIHDDKSTLKRTLLFVTAAVFVIFMIFYTIGNAIENKEAPEEKSVEETTERKKRKTDYDNRIQFYYSLKLLASSKAKVLDKNTKRTVLNEFSNPYPKTFNTLNFERAASENNNLELSNKSGNSLIVFRLLKGKDQSIYIPNNKSAFILVQENDSLLFMTGNNFATSKFSHFKNDMAISDIYKIGSLNNLNSSKITISFDNTIKESIIKQRSIKTDKNILLKRISIDNSYRAYYNKLDY
ncbi:MAG: hypothetical protein ACWA5P_10555 [bacterium]